MEFTKSIEIDAPVERVWKVVAHDFDKVGTWSSAVESSVPNHKAATPEGATVGGRVCATPGFGDIEETFTAYSEEHRTFTFRASGLPSFITLAQNTVKVVPSGMGRSSVSLNIRLDTNAVGKIMGPMFAIKLKATLNTFLDELKDYVERDEVSSKKRKQLVKATA